MVQDSTTYYVWIGGSCDYGHKEPTNEAREAVSKVTDTASFCHVRFFTYLSAANQDKQKSSMTWQW